MGSSLCFGEIYFLNFTHQWDRNLEKKTVILKQLFRDQLKEQDSERKVIMEISGIPIEFEISKNLSWGKGRSQVFYRILLPYAIISIAAAVAFSVSYSVLIIENNRLLKPYNIYQQK